MFLKTKEINIGSLEAEEEISRKSKMHLEEVFYDLIDIDSFFENETKFLLIGGKGTGKSACASVYKKRSLGVYNKFCNIITKADLNFEKIIQEIPQTSINLDKRELKKFLIEWLLLNQLLDLLKNHEYVKSLKEFHLIEDFQVINRGIVSINEHNLIESIKQFSGDVNVDPLNNFIKINFGKAHTFKFKKAFFAQVIPDLKNTIKILFENINDFAINEPYYFTLIFDDLDHDLRNIEEHRDFLIDMLRVVKDYNLKLVDLDKVNFKVVLLLRPDILSELNSYSDSFKLIESYKLALNWFVNAEIEDRCHLRQLINLRIAKALKEFDNRKISHDPWYDLIDKNIDNLEKTAFKLCLDHTRYRPRDLIFLINKVLTNLRANEVVDIIKIKRSLRSYSIGLWQEVQNELSFYFTHDDLAKIERLLKKLPNDFSFYEFENQIEELNYSFDTEKLLSILFNSSVLGNHDNGKFYWKHREGENPISVDYSKDFIVNKGLKENFYDD
jgi:hypothetical protein